MINKLNSEVYSFYKSLQKKSKDDLEEKQKYINSHFPEYNNIQKKIGFLNINLLKVSISDSEDKLSEINRLKHEITRLRERKYELLAENGFPLDFLDPKYKCSKCKDTGFLGGIKCSCFKEYQSKIYAKNSNMFELIGDNNFKNFKLSYFSDNTDSSEPVSPQRNIRRILADIRKYVDDFSSINDNLMFYGKPGTGKSFMSQCIAKELLDAGYLVIYKTANDLIDDLRTISFKQDKDLKDLLFNCDLLIIDDLGSEGNSDFVNSELFNILNKKLLTNKKMLINTNLSLSELSQAYSDRIFSRLVGSFKAYKFYGEDLRIALSLKEKSI